MRDKLGRKGRERGMDGGKEKQKNKEGRSWEERNRREERQGSRVNPRSEGLVFRRDQSEQATVLPLVPPQSSDTHLSKGHSYYRGYQQSF